MINKEDIKDLLTFSKSERNGIVVLLILIFIFSILSYYKKHHFQPEEINPEFQTEVLAYLQQMEESKEHDFALKESNTKKEITLFEFNPNTIGIEQWIQLGLSKKQAEVVLNYRNKGGVFRVKKDVQKMYTVSDEMFTIWESYIDLPEVSSAPKEDKSKEYPTYQKKEYSNSNDNKYDSEKETWVQVYPELNSTDTTELKKLKGIGSFYARKIVEYREELGGYTSLDQLKEIWKMRQETIELIQPFVSIEQSNIKKLNINQAELTDLKSHPYIDYKKAKIIVNYRDQHGSFKSKSDLQKIVLLETDWIDKIDPYLSYD